MTTHKNCETEAEVVRWESKGKSISSAMHNQQQTESSPAKVNRGLNLNQEVIFSQIMEKMAPKYEKSILRHVCGKPADLGMSTTKMGPQGAETVGQLELSWLCNDAGTPGGFADLEYATVSRKTAVVRVQEDFCRDPFKVVVNRQ